MGALWVKFHEALCTGAKRDLSRATRFIYMERGSQENRAVRRVLH